MSDPAPDGTGDPASGSPTSAVTLTVLLLLVATSDARSVFPKFKAGPHKPRVWAPLKMNYRIEI